MSEWIDVNDRLPLYLVDKDYSENVIGVYKGFQGRLCRSIFSRVIVEMSEDGYTWAWAKLVNAYGDLGDADCEFDDDYEVILWMPLPELPATPMNNRLEKQ